MVTGGSKAGGDFCVPQRYIPATHVLASAAPNTRNLRHNSPDLIRANTVDVGVVTHLRAEGGAAVMLEPALAEPGRWPWRCKGCAPSAGGVLLPALLGGCAEYETQQRPWP